MSMPSAGGFCWARANQAGHVCRSEDEEEYM